MKNLLAGVLILVSGVLSSVHAQELSDLETIRTLAASGDRETALEKLESRIVADDNDVQARFLRGLLLLEAGDSVAAQEAFTEITRLFPRLPETYNNLAAIYAMQGEYEKARQALVAAVANAPDYPVASANLGDLYVKLATDAYRRAVELNPQDTGTSAKLKLLHQMFAKDS